MSDEQVCFVCDAVKRLEPDQATGTGFIMGVARGMTSAALMCEGHHHAFRLGLVDLIPKATARAECPGCDVCLPRRAVQ